MVEHLKENIFCLLGFDMILYIFELNRNSLEMFCIKFLCNIQIPIHLPDLSHEISFDELFILHNEKNKFKTQDIKFLTFSKYLSCDEFYVVLSSKHNLHWLLKSKQNDLLMLLSIVFLFNFRAKIYIF